MAIAALRELLEWGVAPIHETVSALTTRIAEGARSLGLTAVARDRRAGHYLGLRSPTPLPGDLIARLAAERVYVSVRGRALRVTPHLYNDAEDVDRLLAVLADLLHVR